MTKTWKTLTCACAVSCAALFLVLILPFQSIADDDDPPGRVARLSYLRGSISFQPAGAPDWGMAVINRPMTSGDKLWVDTDSRAEVQIGSATIRLDSNTGFSFLDLDDHTVQIQLSAGTLGLTVRRLDRDEVFEVDTSNQAFSILEPGHYRLSADEDGNTTIVTVREGQGEATGEGSTYTVESHQAVTLTGTDSLNAEIETTEGRDRDDFDEWCETRDQRESRSASLRYVSPEVVGYQDLEGNGVWRYDTEYGEVWVPTAIPVGWAPYHYGHWSWISPWGWTWVDDAPWGYAPFHYGRWVYTEHTWCWVPGPASIRPVYAPALVAFVGGPNFSVGIAVGGAPVVGWFPLGPREVYVPGYRVSPAYVSRVNISNASVSTTTVTNVYNTTVINNVNTTEVTKITYINRSAPGAVSAVSQTSFSGGQPVASAAVVVNQQQIAAARVTRRAEVAPTSNSLVGPAVAGNSRTVTPPAAVLNRSVVAKVAPPPPPVPFEQQQAGLAQHPGQPLARNEVESLRPANGPQAHPLVRPATEPLSAESSGNELKGQPRSQVGNTQPQSRELDSRPVSASSAQPRREGQPFNASASGVPNYPAASSNEAGRGPATPQEQSPTQPIHEQPSYRPAQVQNGPTAQSGNSHSWQPSSAPPSQPVSSSLAAPHGSVTPTTPPSSKPNVQSTENKVQAGNPAPATQKGNPPRAENKEVDEKKK